MSSMPSLSAFSPGPEPAGAAESRRMARHLAGHTVLALVHGYLFTELRLPPAGAAHADLVACRAPVLPAAASPEEVRQFQLESAGLVRLELCLAGPLAEVRGEPSLQAARLLAGSNDFQAMHIAMTRVHSLTLDQRLAFLDATRARVAALLDALWPAVEALADALSRPGTLDALGILEVATCALVEHDRPCPPLLGRLVEAEYRDALAESALLSADWPVGEAGDPARYAAVQGRVWRLEELLLMLAEHEED